MKPLLLLLSLLLLPTSAMAGRRARPQVGRDPAIVQQALSLPDRTEAILLLEDYLARGRNPALVAEVRIHAGEQRRLAGDLPRARAHFEEAAAKTSRTKRVAELGLALVDLERNRSGNALATLRLVPEKSAPDTMNADRFRLLALEAQAGRGSGDGAALAKKALAYAASDPTVRQRTLLDLAALLPAAPTEPGPATAPEGAERQAIARAEAALAERNFQETLRLVEALHTAFPETELADRANWLAKRARARDPYSARRIGVLLPLSGPYGAAGMQVRRALEMAAEDSGSGMELVFRDTAGEVPTGRTAFESLLIAEGVAAIIGPLLKDVALAVAQDAQASGIPLITLTQAKGITEVGDWVFRGMITPEQQIDSLLAHAMGEVGMVRFAVMAPDNSYGHGVVETFHRQVVERDGQVMITVFYDPEASDLRPYASELGQKDYKARWRELRNLKKDAEKVGMDPDKVVLPPLVDFEAIFIPDSARRVPLVASALAYEEFAIGGFKPKKNMEPLPLMGLNAWHNPKLPELGARYVRHALFVDAFSAARTDPAVEAFVARFSAEIGQDPGVLEAIVYDLGKIVGVATRTSPPSREAFRTALAGVGLSQPVAGGGSFGPTREVHREMIVFTIDTEGIVEVHPDPTLLPPGEAPLPAE
jgi:ABC-type branched-subunit amino acid transport system substrate-binding protein